MNNSKNWVILIIVLLVLGLGYWYFTSGMAPAVTNNMATTTPNGTGATVNTGTQTGGSVQGSTGTGSTGAGSTGTRAYTAQIAITGFTSQSETSFPLVNYTVESALTGNGFFSLIGQNTNTAVWGKNQKIAGSYSIDPNQIDVQGNEPSHKLPPGDYFIRITDSSGAVVGESRPFRIAVGQVTNN